MSLVSDVFFFLESFPSFLQFVCEKNISKTENRWKVKTAPKGGMTLNQNLLLRDFALEDHLNIMFKC